MKNKYLDTDGLNYLLQKLKDTFLLKSQFPTSQSPILFGTIEHWNSRPSLISEKNVVYIYTNYQISIDNKPIAGIKIGDGKAYLIDIPFIDTKFIEHMNNDLIHISEEDRTKWDAKVRCYYALNKEETLVFTTN